MNKNTSKKQLSSKQKAVLKKAVKKTITDYGKTLQLLSKE
jgi:hypothetical protein